MWVLRPAPKATKQYYTNTGISPNCRSPSSKLLSCRKRYRRVRRMPHAPWPPSSSSARRSRPRSAAPPRLPLLLALQDTSSQLWHTSASGSASSGYLRTRYHQALGVRRLLCLGGDRAQESGASRQSQVSSNGTLRGLRHPFPPPLARLLVSPRSRGGRTSAAAHPIKHAVYS